MRVQGDSAPKQNQPNTRQWQKPSQCAFAQEKNETSVPPLASMRNMVVRDPGTSGRPHSARLTKRATATLAPICRDASGSLQLGFESGYARAAPMMVPLSGTDPNCPRGSRDLLRRQGLSDRCPRRRLRKLVGSTPREGLRDRHRRRAHRW